MTLEERLRQLASALPSDDSAVTITRADLVAMLEGDSSEVGIASAQDLTAEEVANETGRASSTVRGWLISEALRGYKMAVTPEKAVTANRVCSGTMADRLCP